MLITDALTSNPAARAGLPPSAKRSARFDPQFVLDTQFVQLLRGYRSSGGLARRMEVLQRLRLRCFGAEEALEAWIGNGNLCSLVWRDQVWLPMFQFSARDMMPKSATKAVADELAPAFLGWDACRWFAEPNAALDGLRPAQLIDTHPAALRQAARADRYAVLG